MDFKLPTDRHLLAYKNDLRESPIAALDAIDQKDVPVDYFALSYFFVFMNISGQA